ncbi:hypothetical protein J6590_098119, partial [Homalodisca vitripennis]
NCSVEREYARVTRRRHVTQPGRVSVELHVLNGIIDIPELSEKFLELAPSIFLIVIHLVSLYVSIIIVGQAQIWQYTNTQGQTVYLVSLGSGIGGL